VEVQRTDEGLIRPVPGRLFHYVKIASWFELCLFTGLLVVWIAPGLEDETAILGLAHGLGFVALAVMVLITVLAHQAPYTLLGATLTPVGPVGSVIAIAWIERREPAEKTGGSAKGVTRPAPAQVPGRDGP
jgi:hypothetical protein